jgi:PAS domain S-box-containing protein
MPVKTAEKTQLSRKAKPISFYIVAALVLWSLLMLGFFTRSMHITNEQMLEIARTQARSSWEKDILYRQWNAQHGGVYVPVSDVAIPNPYLEVEERDMTTPSGIEMTKVNPAYMTRQVHELGATYSGVIGNITSLDPLRPENRADAWETEALKSFEKGHREVSSIEWMEGVEYLRLMRPLVVEQSCLQCHAQQGYQLGDIRGGISVSVPMTASRAITAQQEQMIMLSHGTVWAIGLLVIGLGGRSLGRNMRRRMALERRMLADAIDEKSRLRKILENLPAGLVMARIEDMSLVYANPTFCAMVGYGDEELVGMHASDLHDESTNEKVKEHFAKMREGEFSTMDEVPVVRKDGSIFYAYIAPRPIHINEEATILALFKDVSDKHVAKKAMAEALKKSEEANRVKTEFLQNMSHELRTPLNGIMGMAEIMSMTQLDKEQKEYLNIMQSSAETLLRLVTDLLDYASFQAGKSKLMKRPFALAEVVQSVGKSLEIKASEKGLAIAIKIANGLPEKIVGDVDRFRQIVGNLVDNAIKYTEKGQIEIDLGGHPKDAGQWLIEVSVKDTGIGIDATVKERLFERFFQADSSLRRKNGGMGLGLPICDYYVKAMDGSINIESTPGQGSIFTVTIPFEVTESSQKDFV